MTTLNSPISVSEYKTYPLVKVPTGFTDEQIETQLNNAWRTIVDKCYQPLNQTTNTDIYTFPSKNANVTPAGELKIELKFSPAISLTSVKWSTNIGVNGWTALSNCDLIGSCIICHDAPFSRGGYGLLQVVYASGYTTIPDDLKEACALMTAHLLSGGLFPTQGGVGEGSVLALWIPKDVQDTINRYKRVY